MLHCREQHTVLQQHEREMCTIQRQMQHQRQQRMQVANTATAALAALAAAAAAVQLQQLTLQACSWRSVWNLWCLATLRIPAAALTLTTASTW
jgi:hypothetical protein